MRVLAVAGSSAGHIFPASAFLDGLRDKGGIEFLLVLPKAAAKNAGRYLNLPLRYISIARLELMNLRAIGRFFEGVLESLGILWKFRPDLVVGFGGLACVPLLLWAWLFRIRTVVHEQNVIPGRANRLLFPVADKIAISFSETQRYLKRYAAKVVLTGNPLRKEICHIDQRKARQQLGLSPDKFTILVMGGSLASHGVNTSFLKAASLLCAKDRLQVIHLSGAGDYEFLKRGYLKLGIAASVFSFLKEMQYAYSGCDLVVSRSGATSIAELIFYSLPAVLLPYPFAYQHQLLNAQVLKKKGCAVIIEAGHLEVSLLRQLLEELMNNPLRLQAMRRGYGSFSRFDTASLFQDAALSF